MSALPVSFALLSFVPHLPELLGLGAILVIIFGARKLPELGRGLGEGIKNFRGAMKEMTKGDDETKTKKDG